MVRPGDRRARAQEDQRVEQRQLECVQNLDALGWKETIDRLKRRGEEREIEESPEPAKEEHHLGRNEQNHAVAQVNLDHRRVIAGMGLAYDIGPPEEHG